MKLVIGPTVYDLTPAMENATLNDLYQMTLETGIGMSTLGKKLQRVDTGNLETVMDDPEVFAALRCLIFLARRYAGEKVTVTSANDFAFADLSFEAEPGEEITDEADPTGPTGGAAADVPEPAAAGATGI